MDDIFRSSIPEDEQKDVMKLLSEAAEGNIPREIEIFETSRSSPLDSLVLGSLFWKGREHNFTISVSSGKLSALLSWDQSTRHALAPIEVIVTDAITKGRSAFLLDKWDELSKRSDVSALLRRFDRQHFLNPGSDLTLSLRDRVVSLGFDIVSRDQSSLIRDKLEKDIQPAFRTRRHG